MICVVVFHFPLNITQKCRHRKVPTHLQVYCVMCVCRCKEDKRVPVLTLPRLQSQDTEVRLTAEPLAGPDLAAWQPIERVVKDAVTGQDRCG